MKVPETKHEHRPHFSLRLKLTFWIVAISSVIQTTLVLVGVLYHRYSLAQYFDEDLLQRARGMAEEVRRADCRVGDEDLL